MIFYLEVTSNLQKLFSTRITSHEHLTFALPFSLYIGLYYSIFWEHFEVTDIMPLIPKRFHVF